MNLSRGYTLGIIRNTCYERVVNNMYKNIIKLKKNIHEMNVLIRKLEYCEQCEQYEWFLTILIIVMFMSRLGRHEHEK